MRMNDYYSIRIQQQYRNSCSDRRKTGIVQCEIINQCINIQQLQLMKQITIYSLKVKIISLHFNIRAIDHPLHFALTLADRTLDQKQVEIKQGLLKNNISLCCQLSEREINSHSQIMIVLLEKNTFNFEPIGHIRVCFQEFKNIKMRNFQLQNCFDSSACMQAFLLMMPSRVIEEQVHQKMPNQLTPQLRQSPSFNSNIDISLQIDQEELTFNNIPQKTSANKLRCSRQAETQTYNIESLITLNEILTETNIKLQQQNSNLRHKIQSLHNTLARHAQCGRAEAELKAKIQELQNTVMKKQFQLASKDQALNALKQQKDSLSKEIQKMQKTAAPKQELKIDTIVAQLGKYAETAKKYKTKQSSGLKYNQWKVSPIPKLPLNNIQFPRKDSTSRSSRMRKQQLKSMLNTRQGDNIQSDQTFDTLKDSTVQPL